MLRTPTATGCSIPLGTAFVDGRLSEDQFSAHAARVLASRTYGGAGRDHRQHPAQAERATAAQNSPYRPGPVDKKSLAWGMFLILMPVTLGIAFVTHFVGFLVLFVVAFVGVTVTAQPDS